MMSDVLNLSDTQYKLNIGGIYKKSDKAILNNIINTGKASTYYNIKNK
jgi:hypothetical protein